MRSLHLVTIEDLIERLSLEAGLVRATRFKTQVDFMGSLRCVSIFPQ